MTVAEGDDHSLTAVETNNNGLMGWWCDTNSGMMMCVCVCGGAALVHYPTTPTTQFFLQTTTAQHVGSGGGGGSGSGGEAAGGNTGFGARGDLRLALCVGGCGPHWWLATVCSCRWRRIDILPLVWWWCVLRLTQWHYINRTAEHRQVAVDGLISMRTDGPLKLPATFPAPGFA